MIINRLFFSLLALLSISCEIDTGTDVINERPANIPQTENLIIVTLDGLDWKDVYGDEDVLNRDFLSQHGNLYGNRTLGNKVNVLNPSAMSYPGYAELFTGNVEDITDNTLREGNNETVFEYLNNHLGEYKTQVVSWGHFPYYLFRASTVEFPLFTSYKSVMDGEHYQSMNTLALYKMGLVDFYLEEKYNFKQFFEKVVTEGNRLHPRIHPFGGNTIIDDNEEGELLTYVWAKELIEIEKPKLSYIQFVMTDHFAHLNERENYLKAAKNVGIYIEDLYNTLQRIPQYRDNTTIIITTDHGRAENFRDHSPESFFIVLSPDLHDGIIGGEKQYYNAQIAQTIANILGFEYVADHEIYEPIEL